MTYESMLRRLRPGLTLLETLDACNAGLGGPRSTPVASPIDTVGLPWRVQLDHYGDSADIEVAYTHTGIAARAVAEAAYLVARVVEEETGMVGHDFEVEQPTMTGDPAVAAARLGAVNGWIRGQFG